MCVHLRGCSWTREWHLPRQRLVEHASEAIDVDSGVGLSARDVLGSQIVELRHEVLLLSQARQVGRPPRQREVGQIGVVGWRDQVAGVQPLAHLTAPEFLLHFAPYFVVALSTAPRAGSYTFTALALAAASFWVFIVASLLTLARRRGSFKVTPKTSANSRQPRAVAPALLAIAVLAGVATWGLVNSRDSASLNNAAFAFFHICTRLSAHNQPPAALHGVSG